MNNPQSTSSVAFESTDPFTPEARHLAVVSGGLGDPSQSRMLADRLTEETSSTLSARGITTTVHLIELRLLASAISDALITHNNSTDLADAISEVEQADGIITVSPTFNASYSGLFKSFWDLMEDGAVRGTPVLLGATGGTARHSLVIDQAMRPLFSYLKALAVPTSVYAASDDWGEVEGGSQSTRTAPLSTRISGAGGEFGEVLADRHARVRRSADQPKQLEVTPFSELLGGQ